jgi:Mg2+ and Co2+ transporter CorA
LDTSRNELLIANTALAILSCSIAFGAYITGVFGMNLDNTVYLQPVHGGFAYITSGSFAIMFVIFALIYGYLRYAGILPGKPVAVHSGSKKR